MSGSRSWADLPKELVEKISKCLHTETDSRRFRAVCKSWRSSTPPLKKSPLTHLKLPFPLSADHSPHLNHDGAYLILTERTVYRLQPPECRDPNFWLVKIETSSDGKSRILNPVSDHEIKLRHVSKMPKVLNTLNFRVSEVCKCYTLDYVNPSIPKKKCRYKLARKVAVSVGPNNDEYVIAAIDNYGELWYIKSGDQKWTKVFDDHLAFTRDFLDIVNYKGQFYGVDDIAHVYLFGSMFEEQSFTCSQKNDASKRHLVELFDGELVLVDELTDEAEYRPVTNIDNKFTIWRLDEKRERWFQAKEKFDGTIFLGDDCSFSFSAKEFRKGCKGTRVFYSDHCICFLTKGQKKPHFPSIYDNGYFECYCCDDNGAVDNFIVSDDVKLKFRGLYGHNTGVCDYATRKLGSLLEFPECAKIFWPPPSWLRRR